MGGIPVLQTGSVTGRDEERGQNDSLICVFPPSLPIVALSSSPLSPSFFLFSLVLFPCVTSPLPRPNAKLFLNCTMALG